MCCLRGFLHLLLSLYHCLASCVSSLALYRSCILLSGCVSIVCLQSSMHMPCFLPPFFSCFALFFLAGFLTLTKFPAPASEIAWGGWQCKDISASSAACLILLFLFSYTFCMFFIHISPLLLSSVALSLLDAFIFAKVAAASMSRERVSFSSMMSPSL